MTMKDKQKFAAPLALALGGALAFGALGTGITASTPNAYAEAVSVPAPKVPGFADVVDAVSPAVVSVRVEAGLELADNRGRSDEFRFDRRFFEDDDDMPFFRHFRERGERYGKRGPRSDRRHQKRRFGMSQGSGFFVSEDGYLVTNQHVIGNGNKFTVIMNDGSEMEAKLVGSDKRSDLAVLKVDTDKKLTYVEFDDENPRIGDWVVAVGNPFGLGGTVTAGIVSAHGREIRSNKYDDFIQIDAAVNKGNSGGPTFNLEGKVIGVNTAIFSPSGGNVGIAFAIPASLANEIVTDLMDDGKVMRGWLGVQIQPVTKDIAESVGLDDAKGAIVAGAQEDSPAAKAGLKPGDIITAVDGKKIKGPRALARKIGKLSPNKTVSITVWRDGNAKDVSVKLGTLDEASTGDKQGSNLSGTGLARLGLELLPGDDGVQVVDVVPGSRAFRRGVRPGDVITSINGEQVKTPDQVVDLLSQVRKLNRKAALFQIEREGDSRFVAIPVTKG